MATQGPYNYGVAKIVLNENDKDRFLACFLNMTDPTAVSRPPSSSSPSRTCAY
jgi:hypothetical protein